MNRLFPILLLLLWCTGCAKDDNVLPEQQTQFVSYLTTQHAPRLIDEVSIPESTEQNPDYYTARGETAYRYIRHVYDPVRESYPEVAYGDRLTLTFWMYVFEFKNIFIYGNQFTLPYYTNDVKLKEALEQMPDGSGLTPGEWKFEPLEVELGTTEILKGLEYALPGCRERDTVEVYMTYKMAYGSKPVGVVPKEAPVAVFVVVDKVTKN